MEISAVVIAKPVSTHYQLGLNALQAVIYVFVEKPFIPSFT
ncbi:MAG: Gfo/Idh/MocA family oxidoreductase [Armatimonadetes bacterium]|nr:Gfo/Idh/MocA family oxidoreductase [Armatimonadota bacterium]